MRPFHLKKSLFLFIGFIGICLRVLYCSTNVFSSHSRYNSLNQEKNGIKDTIPSLLPLDSSLYLQKMMNLIQMDERRLWTAPKVYPKSGALLPFCRVVAFYGNFYSAQMGILGQYSSERVIEKLKEEVTHWKLADSTVKVIPAIHYIAVTAQRDSGIDHMYRLRMPSDQINRAVEMAKKIDGLVFLDIQPGLSSLQLELPKLKRYLSLPNVHLAIDPEYAIKTDSLMTKVIGTLDAADINFASKFLAILVTLYNLPPKILVVHRFTKNMLTNSKNIVLRPEVQVVIHMDGFGSPAKKMNSYRRFIYSEPVQFTGFKLFYKNDVDSGFPLMTPDQILRLVPKPVYIQYQ